MRRLNRLVLVGTVLATAAVAIVRGRSTGSRSELPCGSELLRRVQAQPVFAPFDDGAFLRGEAVYGRTARKRTVPIRRTNLW